MIHNKLGGLIGDAERIARVAVAAYDMASLPATAPSGTASYDNGDGTRTVIGPQAGGRTIATHVGDLTPPPVPSGIRAWSGDGRLHVTWDGTLDGPIPPDFSHVDILADGRVVAQMRSAGSVTVDGFDVGQTVSVTAASEDDACLADGTPAHNVSDPCAAIIVTIADALSQAKETIDAARADIDDFKRAAEATYSTKTEVDEKTKAVTESIEATYLKKDDASTAYATKTELSRSADGLRSEVSEEYVTKNDAAKTYAGKSTFEQLATSIKSLVRGESTYTDPDGRSATSGIYSLVTQARDAVTALFGDYTKTSDLAATEAVKAARKAGTDAQATANAAKSAASSAKSTADSLATLIRADSTGITVGKSADGKTYSTGRTHMDEDSFDVLDNAGNVIATFGGAVASMLMGMLTIAARQGGGGSIYPARGKVLMLKSGKDAEISGNHGSYIEIGDVATTISSKPAGGKANVLTVSNTGIYAQTQGGSSLKLCAVHSLYNPYNGMHVYTGKASEISSMVGAGWTDEGAKFYAFVGPGQR